MSESNRACEILDDLLPGAYPVGNMASDYWIAFDNRVVTLTSEQVIQESKDFVAEILRLRAEADRFRARLTVAQERIAELAKFEAEANHLAQFLGNNTPPQCKCGGVPSVSTELAEAYNRIGQLSDALGKPLEGANFPRTVPKDKKVDTDEMDYYVHEIRTVKALLDYAGVTNNGSIADRLVAIAKKWFAYHEISSQDKISSGMRGILRDTGHTDWMAARNTVTLTGNVTNDLEVTDG